MSNKILLAILVVIFGAIGTMMWKVNSSSVLGVNSGSGIVISLSTSPSPPKLGPVTFLIEIKDKNGKPIDDSTLTYDLNMTTMNMGTQKGTAASNGDGLYSISGTLSMSGPWRLRITVKTSDGSIENKEFNLNV